MPHSLMHALPPTEQCCAEHKRAEGSGNCSYVTTAHSQCCLLQMLCAGEETSSSFAVLYAYSTIKWQAFMYSFARQSVYAVIDLDNQRHLLDASECVPGM